MFVCYMVVAPTIALTLFVQLTATQILWAFALSALSFIALLLLGYLNLENSYVLSLPALLVVVFSSLRQTGNTK